MSSLISYLGGLLLGWSFGANDSANMFGTAVASRMVRYRTAVLLIAGFVAVGAVLQGHEGIKTVSAMAGDSQRVLVICTFSVVLTMAFMRYLRIPVSGSQMMIGAVIGVGIARQNVVWRPILKVFTCWLFNPVCAMLIAVVLYKIFAWPIRRFRPSVFVLDSLLRFGLIVCGCYGAYALGANGVGIFCVAFVGDAPGLIPANSAYGLHIAAALGGLSIGVGAVTYGRPLMMAVGKGIVPLDAFTAFIAVLSLAVTVHIFAIVGAPVSTAQSIVGGLIGIGLIKGLHIVNQQMLKRVIIWWLISPVISGIVSTALYFTFIVKK